MPAATTLTQTASKATNSMAAVARAVVRECAVIPACSGEGEGKVCLKPPLRAHTDAPGPRLLASMGTRWSACTAIRSNIDDGWRIMTTVRRIACAMLLFGLCSVNRDTSRRCFCAMAREFAAILPFGGSGVPRRAGRPCHLLQSQGMFGLQFLPGRRLGGATAARERGAAPPLPGELSMARAWRRRSGESHPVDALKVRRATVPGPAANLNDSEHLRNSKESPRAVSIRGLFVGRKAGGSNPP
jgi:hypothetical protein